MNPKIYHLQALSALHCGIGQSAGVVDLPIARDKATNLPLVPGSSLRGVLREELTAEDEASAKILFGPKGISGASDAYAGALALGDAHLLLLPVRALAGIMAYATCPFILQRYAKDAGVEEKIPQPGNNTALCAAGNVNVIDNKVVLEELDLNWQQSDGAAFWAKEIASTIYAGDDDAQQDFTQRFLILPDSVFAFLADTATEIRARIAIDQNTGVVAKGALWYEENLPAETVLWGIYALSDSRHKGDKLSAEELQPLIPAKALLQLGGKAGVGRGLVNFFSGGAA
ncbi:type III-B CRISPR module RAMP protein Cmr4 [Rheinheimera sediminis]|uniref:type III-B CRISPR module RAMP protein Cmr4 n=1 Tax=Rheinheimera sp. YQF-1 TaxID=2499626 RepID=UPI000FD8DB34|nr:type III-B CRISPR module RAMP protein Cmr4 [Rheinheimera sp. YQF-1]RVT47826.1 type III-B CRISPR module RAMP protein Cmr4 [Rheinheimera sp. YQF-1]